MSCADDAQCQVEGMVFCEPDLVMNENTHFQEWGCQGGSEGMKVPSGKPRPVHSVTWCSHKFLQTQLTSAQAVIIRLTPYTALGSWATALS